MNGFSWWEQITGPAMFLRRIAIEMHGFNQIVIQRSGALPFWNMLFQRLTQDMEQFLPFVIDEWQAGWDPGEYLLDRHVSRDQRVGYRPARDDLTAFLAESRALNGNLFWIKDIPEDQAARWYKFLGDWAVKDSDRRTLFILECGEIPLLKRKHVTVLRYEEAVSQYDMLLFASSLVAELEGTPEIKQYLAWLAARLALRDPERCAGICSRAWDMIWRPEAFGVPMKAAQWEAQSRHCLPEIERRRLEIVKNPDYYAYLLQLLPQPDDYDNQITVPEEMELRHIIHYTAQAGQRIFPQEVWDELKRLRQMRNDLAHLKPLAPEDLTSLLGDVASSACAVGDCAFGGNVVQS